MGDIVEFKPASGRKAQSNGDGASAKSADILFFTGVRYERQAEDNARDGKTPGEGANGSGSRKRRRRA